MGLGILQGSPQMFTQISPRALLSLVLFVSAVFLATLAFARVPRSETKREAAAHRKIPTTPTPLAAGNSGPGWSIVSAPTTGDDELYGVGCGTNTDCWAVGYYFPGAAPAQTLIEHWNGTSWSIASSPNSSSVQGNILNAITCLSGSDCWAVGNHGSGSIWQTLIEHWDGNNWSIVSSPNANASADNRLWGVSCSANNNCWAVGYFSNGINNQTLILHWDGSSWLIATSSNTNVSVTNELSSVTCVSDSDCWAVGGSSDTNYQTLIEYWNGSSWSIVASPSFDSVHDSVLGGVACKSSSDCVAVGLYDDGSGSQTLGEHWNGVAWEISPSPNYGRFQRVACAAGGDCWAVGLGSGQTVVAKWDGAAWSAMSSPNVTGVSNSFAYDVACPSASECWMVGSSFYYTGTKRHALIEEYSLTVPPLIRVASRMTHGTAGTFDVDLPILGKRGVDCRSGGANGNYSVVFTFVNDVTNCGSAGTAGGTIVPGPNLNQCTENLNGVANPQYINVELDNIVDSQSNTGNVAVSMGVLVGDTTANGVVNSSDISQTQSQSGLTVTADDFREDVTGTGSINSSDIALVQSKSGTGLPSSP